jgi:hypothetical protein
MANVTKTLPLSSIDFQQTDIQCISSSSARVPGEVIRLFVTFLKVFLFLIFFYFLFYFNFSTLKLLKNNKRTINLMF